MIYSRKLTEKEIAKINNTAAANLLGQVIGRGSTGVIAVTNELGEEVQWYDKDPLEELDSFKIPGAYRYQKAPKGFTGYAWFIISANDYLCMDEFANFYLGENKAHAVRFYTRGLANRFKDKIEQLCGFNLYSKFMEDWTEEEV